MRVPIGVSKSPAGFVLLLFLLGCSDVTNADPDAGDGEPPGPMPDGAAAAPDPDPIDAAVRDEPAPMLDGVDDCANAPPIEGDYPAPGCRYDIAIPNLVVDVRPSCGAASDPPAGLRLTFPHRDPSRHMAVAWTTEAPTRVSEVRLGTDPDALDQVFRGHSFTYQTLDPRRVHEVHLCGLTPATTYYYQAGGEGGWSDVGSFATAPEDEAEPFTFAVLGDTRSIDFVMWHDALEQIATMGVDFLLFAGDAVVFGLAQEQWDDWFAAGQPYLASLPIIPANGNHDFIGVHWLAQFALPRNEENYSYRYGNTAIVAMTDTFVHEGGVIEGRARTFLDATLTDNADARWKMLLNHRCFYSASLHGRAPDLVREWLPLVDAHEVDVVFNGHDHNYERSKPLRGDAVVPEGEGTVYVVSSGVGAPLYASGKQWWTEISSSEPTFAIVRVSPAQVEVTAYRLDGTRLDRFTLRK